jgi:PAS domain S-box-containing protein
MQKRSDTQNLQGDLREKIIGLGERSLRKSYYPELQRRLAELEASETALADAARKWQVTFDAISDPICLIDLQGKILQCNRAMASFASQPVEEIVGNNYWEVVYGTTKPIDACPILRLRKSLRRETQLLALGDRWVEVTVDPILDDSGGLMGAVHILSDITARQRAEEALRASEEHVRLKLDSILSPDADIINQDLSNILDTPAIQSLMEDFYKLTNMGMAILDLQGKVLVATGWQDICTQYHRVHPQTAQNCTESDLLLAQDLQPGEYVAYRCQNHLWDVATPLFIGGKHVGNIYTGQFFYDDEPVDERLFIDQAAKYGFDQKPYLSALQRVPRLSRDRVKPLMDFLMKFSALVSKLSYSNLKLAQAMSEQQRIEAALRQSEELYRYLFENMLNGFAYCKMLFEQNQPQDFIYLKVNSSFERLTGLKNVAGKKVSEVIPGIRESDPELLELYGRVALTGKPERFEIYLEALKMWFSISVFSPEKEYFVFIFDVITERKRAEAEIVRKSDQLRALAARLAEVEETERQHLARQLHDQVCQSLTALGLTLTLLQTQMPRKRAAALRGRLADALALVEQTGETVRNVMADLRPPMLDDYGLLSALNWYGVEFFAKTGISVEVQGQEADPRLAPPVELALFRIVQEAMANVAKHARATKVVLTEEMDNGALRLVIADNGVGFDQKRLGQPEARHLWGILTMSERAAGAGGCCRIESQPGQGTRVVVEVSR